MKNRKKTLKNKFNPVVLPTFSPEMKKKVMREKVMLTSPLEEPQKLPTTHEQVLLDPLV